MRFRSGRDLFDKERSRTTIPFTCNKYNKGWSAQDVITGTYANTVIAGGNIQGINVGKISGHEAAVTLPSRTNQTSNSPPINQKVSPVDPNHSNLPTPVRWKILDNYLEGYRTNLRRYLIDGFRFGFRDNFSGERCSQTSPNLKATLENPEIIEQKLETELSLGRIDGPFDCSPFPQFKISPSGLVPKRQQEQFRLILPRKPNNYVSEEPRQNQGRGLVDRKLVEAPQ